MVNVRQGGPRNPVLRVWLYNLAIRLMRPASLVLSLLLVGLNACDRSSPEVVPMDLPADSPESLAERPESAQTGTSQAVDADGRTRPPATSAHSDTQDSFDEQLQLVMAGQRSTVQLTQAPIAPEQLEQLLSVQGKLTDLLLDAGGVSDMQCQFLAQLSQLEHLRIRESGIGDSGFAALASGSLSQLTILNLPAANATSEGILQLAHLPQLTQLRLGGRQLDDRAMRALASLPSLRSLHLIGPQITDAGLTHLADAPRLTSLYIDDCELSSAAWEALFEAKPSLHVHVDQAHHDRDPGKHEHQ